MSDCEIVINGKSLESRIRSLEFGTVKKSEVFRCTSYEVSDMVYVFKNIDKFLRHTTQRCIKMNIDGKEVVYSKGSTVIGCKYSQNTWIHLNNKEVVIDISRGVDIIDYTIYIKMLRRAYVIMFTDEIEVDKQGVTNYLDSMITEEVSIFNNNLAIIKEYKQEFYKHIKVLDNYLRIPISNEVVKISNQKNNISKFILMVIGERTLSTFREHLLVETILSRCGKEHEFDIYKQAVIFFFQEDDQVKSLIFVASYTRSTFIVSTYSVTSEDRYKNMEISLDNNDTLYDLEDLPLRYRWIAIHMMGSFFLQLSKEDLWGFKYINILLNSLATMKWSIDKYGGLRSDFKPYNKTVTDNTQWVRVYTKSCLSVISVEEVIRKCYRYSSNFNIQLVGLCTGFSKHMIRDYDS